MKVGSRATCPVHIGRTSDTKLKVFHLPRSIHRTLQLTSLLALVLEGCGREVDNLLADDR